MFLYYVNISSFDKEKEMLRQQRQLGSMRWEIF